MTRTVTWIVLVLHQNWEHLQVPITMDERTRRKKFDSETLWRQSPLLVSTCTTHASLLWAAVTRHTQAYTAASHWESQAGSDGCDAKVRRMCKVLREEVNLTASAARSCSSPRLEVGPGEPPGGGRARRGWVWQQPDRRCGLSTSRLRQAVHPTP